MQLVLGLPRRDDMCICEKIDGLNDNWIVEEFFS